MNDSSNIYKLMNNPQMSAPFKFITGGLNNTNHPYEVAGINVNDLKPTQPFIDTDIVDDFVNKLNNGEELDPIWVSKDNDILDGHKRMAAHMIARPDGAVPSIRLMCDKKTGMDILNEIEKSFKEHKLKYDQSDVLRSLSEENNSMYIPDKPIKTKKEVITAYRKLPLKKNISGNFFVTKPLPGYKPYEIEFQSMFRTDSMDKKIGSTENPPKALAEFWFPTLDFKTKTKDFGMSENDLINTLIAEKARTKGIDGILYGEKLIQSIDDK